MRHQHTFRTAIKALRRNVMRAALTTLGIVIGVAAVIAMMEIGKGSSTAIQNTIASMGANILLVLPGQAASGGISFGAGSAMTLTPEDCEAIAPRMPGRRRGRAPSSARARRWSTATRTGCRMQMYGTTPAFLEVRDWTHLAEGECFTDRDVRNASKVCLIGQTLVRELFQGESPVGKEIRVQRHRSRSSACSRKKGANMMGMDQDDILLAPWTTIKYRVDRRDGQPAPPSASTPRSTTVNTLNQIYPIAGVEPSPVPGAFGRRGRRHAAAGPVHQRDQILVAAQARTP